jgi:D-threo-aldose 1-dehydrogenase
MPEVFGYEVPVQEATAAVRRFLAGPLNFLDTAAWYGEGRSEQRIGAALADAGGLPEGFVLSTKVDPDPTTGDYSGRQVRRSFEASLERLGLDRVDLLHLHDPEVMSFEEATAAGGPVEELVRIKDEGLVRALGVGGGPVALMAQFVRTGAFDVLLTHNRWTLVDRSADALLDEAVGLDVGVMNAAPYGGGILAEGAARRRTYAYRPASPETLSRVRSMEAACARHGVPLAAAGLQFSMRDPRITSTVVGVTRPDHVDDILRNAMTTVPEALWAELQPLAAPEADWLW